MKKEPYIQSVRWNEFSPEHLLEVVRGARFEHYILSRAKCNARLDRWSLGDFTVDIGRYSFPVRAVGSFPRNRLCLGYMRNSTAPTWVNCLTADQDTLEFYPEGVELNYCAAPHGEWVAIEFEEGSLQNAARERLGHEVALPWKHTINFRVSRVDRSALDRMVRRLWKHPVSGALMINPILGAIAEMLHSLTCRSTELSRSMSQHRRIVLKRADEFLRENLTSPFQVKALATATGTTVRTLQRMFNDAYGVTPKEWVRCLALHRARQHLRSPTARVFTVQGIAESYGFRHMGRFSKYYRELFGESPSSTLAADRDTKTT